MVCWDAKIPYSQGSLSISFFFFFFFLLLLLTTTKSCCLTEIRSIFISKSSKYFCASHFLGQDPACSNTTRSYGQISVFCTIPRGSPFPPRLVQNSTYFALICWIRLSFFWSFRLDHHITYIVASYLFLFYYYESFSLTLMVFSLESEWQQVSRILLRVLADLSNPIVTIVSTCPLISMPSS